MLLNQNKPITAKDTNASLISLQNRIEVLKKDIASATKEITEAQKDLEALEKLTSPLSNTNNVLKYKGSEIATTELLDKYTKFKDVRETNEPPSYYYTNYPMRTVHELKICDRIGISGNFYFCSLTTYVDWRDNSASIMQQANLGDRVCVRYSITQSDAWSDWKEIAVKDKYVTLLNYYGWLSDNLILYLSENISNYKKLIFLYRVHESGVVMQYTIDLLLGDRNLGLLAVYNNELIKYSYGVVYDTNIWIQGTTSSHCYLDKIIGIK